MRTPGPWGLRGHQIRADGGTGQHVATYQISADDGRLIAAAPELLEMLLQCDLSDQIRVRLQELGLVDDDPTGERGLAEGLLRKGSRRDIATFTLTELEVLHILGKIASETYTMARQGKGPEHAKALAECISIWNRGKV